MANEVEGKLYESITGQLFEIGRQLRQRSGYPFDPKELQKYLQNAVEGRFGIGSIEKPSTVNPFAVLKYSRDLFDENKYLKLISGNETLIIDKCEGKRIIPDATDIFSFIDSDFRSYRANEAGQATTQLPVRVYEQKSDGTYVDIFGSIASVKDSLCLTQDQIIGFVVKYRYWLRKDDCGTIFIFKSFGNYFVADVHFGSVDTLRVNVNKFESGHLLYAECRHRFVFPLLVS